MQIIFFHVSNDENIETEILDTYITTTSSGKQPRPCLLLRVIADCMISIIHESKLI